MSTVKLVWATPDAEKYLAYMARVSNPTAKVGDPCARLLRYLVRKKHWSPCDMVYLFQRPESMPRAMEKAEAELRPGAWLVSLEFDVPGMRPHARLQNEGHRPVWIYAIR